MPDISKCEGGECPLKEKCYRYTCTPDPYWQAYSDFKYKDGCDYFWPLPPCPIELPTDKPSIARGGASSN